MNQNFNELSPAETERLAYLIEECGEVQQIAGKILRHGYESYNPFDEKKISNRKLLIKELTNVLQAMTRMEVNNDIKGIVIGPVAYHNLKYWHHQPEINYEDDYN